MTRNVRQQQRGWITDKYVTIYNRRNSKWIVERIYRLCDRILERMAGFSTKHARLNLKGMDLINW